MACHTSKRTEVDFERKHLAGSGLPEKLRYHLPEGPEEGHQGGLSSWASGCRSIWARRLDLRGLRDSTDTNLLKAVPGIRIGLDPSTFVFRPFNFCLSPLQLLSFVPSTFVFRYSAEVDFEPTHLQASGLVCTRALGPDTSA